MLKNVLSDLSTKQQISSKIKYIAGISECRKVVTEAWYLEELFGSYEVLLVIFKEVGDMYT